MKEQYIKQVKKNLVVSGNAKKEVVRDLEEIFASAAEHGESEGLVIERLGAPEEYAQEASRAFGCESKGQKAQIGIILKVLVAALSLVFGVFSVVLYGLTKSPLSSVGIIGGADGPTTIILANPSSPDAGWLFLVLAGIALFVFILMLVSLVRSKKKDR